MNTKSQLAVLPQPPKAIICINPKSGGKSTILAHLWCLLVMLGLRTKGITFDNDQKTLRHLTQGSGDPIECVIPDKARVQAILLTLRDHDLTLVDSPAGNIEIILKSLEVLVQHGVMPRTHLLVPFSADRDSILQMGLLWQLFHKSLPMLLVMNHNSADTDFAQFFRMPLYEKILKSTETNSVRLMELPYMPILPRLSALGLIAGTAIHDPRLNLFDQTDAANANRVFLHFFQDAGTWLAVPAGISELLAPNENDSIGYDDVRNQIEKDWQ